MTSDEFARALTVMLPSLSLEDLVSLQGATMVEVTTRLLRPRLQIAVDRLKSGDVLVKDGAGLQTRPAEFDSQVSRQHDPLGDFLT